MAVLAACVASPVSGQLRVHLTGTAAGTHANAGPEAASVSQVRVERVVLRSTLASRNGWWQAWASGNFEDLTMPGGALSIGAHGEGFIDSRHPHTYVHELGGSLVVPLREVRASLSAGRGFVAFGTDDPMHQPALAYPLNHHWSQIVERLVVIGGVAIGPMRVEASLFNGDEPESAGQWPSWNRFGDSWALRAMVLPARSLEAQLSYARVRSPEHRGGAGPDATKWSASVSRQGPQRAHLEWARTAESGRQFTSVLLTAEWATGLHRPYVRLEHTDRPEEERAFDLFRTVRPHAHDHILGITRWTVGTVGYGLRARVGDVTIEPIAEGALAHVTERTGGLFDPVAFYGRSTILSVTVAIRLHWGTAGTMGRYGIQDASGPDDPHHH